MKIYFEWTKNMSVEEGNIDHQHQKLLDQLNKVIDAMVFGVDSKEVHEAVNFFDKYCKEHFSYEEHYMKEHSYPYIEEHKNKHQEFSGKYIVFKEKLNSGMSAEQLITEIETYLGKWWIEHIGKEDQKYHSFIKENNL